MGHLKRCNKCGNRCCRYVAIEIDTPRTDQDFDDIRWYVAHRKVTVFKHDGVWHFNVDTKCKQLGNDGRCKIYDKRPRICREYDLDECEEGGIEYEVHLRSVKQVDKYIRERRKRLDRRRKRASERRARKSAGKQTSGQD